MQMCNGPYLSQSVCHPVKCACHWWPQTSSPPVLGWQSHHIHPSRQPEKSVNTETLNCSRKCYVYYNVLVPHTHWASFLLLSYKWVKSKCSSYKKNIVAFYIFCCTLKYSINYYWYYWFDRVVGQTCGLLKEWCNTSLYGCSTVVLHSHIHAVPFLLVLVFL